MPETQGVYGCGLRTGARPQNRVDPGRASQKAVLQAREAGHSVLQYYVSRMKVTGRWKASLSQEQERFQHLPAEPLDLRNGKTATLLRIFPAPLFLPTTPVYDVLETALRVQGQRDENVRFAADVPKIDVENGINVRVLQSEEEIENDGSRLGVALNGAVRSARQEGEEPFRLDGSVAYDEPVLVHSGTDVVQVVDERVARVEPEVAGADAAGSFARFLFQFQPFVDVCIGFQRGVSVGVGVSAEKKFPIDRVRAFDRITDMRSGIFSSVASLDRGGPLFPPIKRRKPRRKGYRKPDFANPFRRP